MTEFKITAESLEAAKKHFKESAQIPGKPWSTCFSESLDALFVPRDEGEGWVEVNNPFGSPDFHKGEYGLRSLMTDWNLYLLQSGTIIKTLTPASTTLTEAQAWANRIIKEREAGEKKCRVCGATGQVYSACAFKGGVKVSCPACRGTGLEERPTPITPDSKFRMPDGLGDKLQVMRMGNNFVLANLTANTLSCPNDKFIWESIDDLHAALLAARAVRMEEGE